LVLPAILEWQVGLNEKDGPTPMVETVLPATYKGRAVWRVVHRDPDPTQEGADSFDMYDVDRETLVPLRSVMQREGFYLGLSFEGEKVTLDKREGDQRQQTEVRVRNPMPEGPGMRVLLAALPLRPGYETSFPIVDRWAADETRRIQTVDLSVPQRRKIRTRMGEIDALEVILAPRDGAFRIQTWVRAHPPRYSLNTEYVRGDLRLVSEVTRMVLGGEAEASSR
jgi:hypothetical protein